MSGNGTGAIREDAARNVRTNNIVYELHTSPVRANKVHGKGIVAAPQGTASCNTNSRAVGHLQTLGNGRQPKIIFRM
jgi:hypothetical protein